MTTLFIADLHLEDARPDATDRFLRFLRDEARGADALYLLGDLFEAWVGDDDPADCGKQVAEGLSALAASGTAVGFLHGNRDFLIGHGYAARCGMAVLPDPCVAMIEGRPTLLSHGDQLCSDDLAYQAFRAQVRDWRWQAQFLAQPLAARLAFAQQARAASKARYGELLSGGSAETITDVTPAAVAALHRRYGIRRIIHGHTHRPAIHDNDDGNGNTRIVLGDWYGEGPRYLRAARDAIELLRLD